ncbi:MAG: AAA family ATPase [Myxococcota bacterium]
MDTGLGDAGRPRTAQEVDSTETKPIDTAPIDTAPTGESTDRTVDQVLARVRGAAGLRATWLRELWSQEPRSGGAETITHAEADAAILALDHAPVEREWLRKKGLSQKPEPLDDAARLLRLERLFGLTAAESDLLQACLASDVDPAIARLFGYLHDDASRCFVTETLVQRLFGHGRSRIYAPESALARFALVHRHPGSPGEPGAFTIDPLVRDWLDGEHRLDGALVRMAQLQPSLSPLPSWPVESLARRASEALDGTGVHRARLVLTGSPGSGRRTLAAAVAGELGLPLLVVEPGPLAPESFEPVFLSAQRQAFLDECAVAWVGDGPAAACWPDYIPRFPLQFLIVETGAEVSPAPGVIDHHYALPLPSVAERRVLWRSVPGASDWADADVERLARRERTLVGDIASVASRGTCSAEEAGQLVRAASRQRLGDLARRLECPFRTDDLIVPPPVHAALADFVFEAQHRTEFWEGDAARRLFPEGRGLFALFTGTPGTGKTMGAQVIAQALDLDLYRISLAAVVSKYVGETAKNLQRVLHRAAEMDCVLLFDEADALFSRRTEIKDAQDRFANTNTNFLLQAIEAYRGIAVLSTNKKANIDPAFIRRLRYVVDFPRPAPEHRRTLWTRLIRELAGEEASTALRPTTDRIAETLEFSGAQIKYAVLAAIFASRQERRPLASAHLFRGLDRELLKEGRALDARTRERLGGRA